MSLDDTCSDSEYSLPSLSETLCPVIFKTIRTKGDIPSPRANFSLTKLSKLRAFLYGGGDDDQDFNDGYLLDLITMKWTRVNVDIKYPLVGHASVCLYRSLNEFKPYVYIFGGWNGTSYSDKGLLINPKTFEALTSNYNDPGMIWSSNHKGSFTPCKSKGSDASTIGTTSPLLTPPGMKSVNSMNSKINTAPELKSGIHSMPAVSPRQNTKTVSWFASVRSGKAKTYSSVKDMIIENAPFSRRDHTLTFDPDNQKLYLYGGWNSLQWNSDESKFFEVWSLDSNWHWTKENVKGDVPIARRGHTAVYAPKRKSIIIYGGCSGGNAILDDCYEYIVDKCKFKQISGAEDDYLPLGRAWHSAELIGNIIYYYGGLNEDFKPTREVIGFDVLRCEWKTVQCLNQQAIPCMERYAHSTWALGTSILIMGGSTHVNEGRNSEKVHEQKVGFANLLLLETDESSPFENSLNQAKIEEAIKTEFFEQQSKTNIPLHDDILGPPSIPPYLKDSSKLIEEQANFLHWNPHIFPHESNKQKIQHFKKKLEAATRFTFEQYPEFEGLGDEESPTNTKQFIKSQSLDVLDEIK